MVGFCHLTDSHHYHHGQKPTMVGICHGGNMLGNLLDSREQQQARKPCQRFGHTGEPAKQRRRKEEKEEKKEIGMKTEAILGRCLASIVFHPHFSSN